MNTVRAGEDKRLTELTLNARRTIGDLTDKLVGATAPCHAIPISLALRLHIADTQAATMLRLTQLPGPCHSLATYPQVLPLCRADTRTAAKLLLERAMLP